MNQIMAAIDSPKNNNKHHLKIVGFGILSLSKTGCCWSSDPGYVPKMMSQLDGSTFIFIPGSHSANLILKSTCHSVSRHLMLTIWRKNVTGMDIKQRMVYEFIGPTKIRATRP